MSRWIKVALAGLGFLALAAVLAVVFVAPPLAAAVCPACYGLERAAPGLIVDKAMPPAARERLAGDAAAAGDTVRAFYGAFDHAPLLIACASDACERRLGGRGALAGTFSTPLGDVIHLSPAGLNGTILAHEFSHVALHHRAGLVAVYGETIPAWFDEGVAVVVSDDARYLKPGASAQERCVAVPAGPLPSGGPDWGARAAKDRMVYAEAACQVLTWMEANGGRDGLLAAIDAAAQGRPPAP
ncbi:hypothetical protein [Xanthobacter sediminis]